VVGRIGAARGGVSEWSCAGDDGVPHIPVTPSPVSWFLLSIKVGPLSLRVEGLLSQKTGLRGHLTLDLVTFSYLLPLRAPGTPVGMKYHGLHRHDR